MSEQKIKIGITQGDINGIGYETIIKAFADSRLLELYTPVIYGSLKVAAYHKKLIPEAEALAFHPIRSAREAQGKKLNLIAVGDDNAQVELGVSTPVGGQNALASLQAATKDLEEGLIDAIVTSPINKANIQSEAFHFPGHTEYLDARFHATEPLMMMVSELMRVGLVTMHLPLAEVAPHITTAAILEKLRALKLSLTQDFAIRAPRIAVLALNPHAGDSGLLGTEEDEIIKPAITAAVSEQILAFGPFAADGFFGSGAYKQYDAVLAMYHDQGLAPFKALAGEEEGVNFTAGLSVVRTSPAHGTGYDIAGKNVANEGSFRAALYLAADIVRNRKIYREITANPLRKYEIDRGGRDMSIKDLPTEASEE
ncbi:MAG: 4-hydroxythreonine-4-phosphate dehydrogenase PdxA [Rikenellaceae bacterium]|jgi:4-hydroxythreonine-4-phosphate dehydrogenase|nr:4-hydroxythreonine-4-phosphate dehydrogenase PdxA [Rikenellaceae bacterium]